MVAADSHGPGREASRSDTPLPMASSRQSSLHNPPLLKPWGSQRLLRCIKVPERPMPLGTPGSGGRGGSMMPLDPHQTAVPRDHHHHRPHHHHMNKDVGLPKIREKTVVHLHDNSKKSHPPLPPSPPRDAVTWNLRTRRASYTRPGQIQLKEQGKLDQANYPPPPCPPRALRRKPGEAAGEEERQRKPRCTISVTLSREEIDEDIYMITGRRASRRPKKRSRTMKRQLDMLFPGFYLTEVTAGAYEVEVPDTPQDRS